MSLLIPPSSQPGASAKVRLGPRTRWLAPGVAAVAVVAAMAMPVESANATVPAVVAREYDLKAAFLFNFAQFVEWPADAFAAANSPITIGILGTDPFGDRLDSLVAGETVRNRRLVVRRYRSIEQVDACHILFIAASEGGQLSQIAKALAHRSVLTVGETKDFTARSGIVGFELSQRRVRLRINLDAASVARLTISSKLLRQARIVASGEGRE
jgi:hypothetical protein